MADPFQCSKLALPGPDQVNALESNENSSSLNPTVGTDSNGRLVEQEFLNTPEQVSFYYSNAIESTSSHPVQERGVLLLNADEVHLDDQKLFDAYKYGERVYDALKLLGQNGCKATKSTLFKVVDLIGCGSKDPDPAYSLGLFMDVLGSRAVDERDILELTFAAIKFYKVSQEAEIDLVLINRLQDLKNRLDFVGYTFSCDPSSKDARSIRWELKRKIELQQYSYDIDKGKECLKKMTNSNGFYLKDSKVLLQRLKEKCKNLMQIESDITRGVYHPFISIAFYLEDWYYANSDMINEENYGQRDCLLSMIILAYQVSLTGSIEKKDTGIDFAFIKEQAYSFLDFIRISGGQKQLSFIENQYDQALRLKRVLDKKNKLLTKKEMKKLNKDEEKKVEGLNKARKEAIEFKLKNSEVRLEELRKSKVQPKKKKLVKEKEKVYQGQRVEYPQTAEILLERQAIQSQGKEEHPHFGDESSFSLPSSDLIEELRPKKVKVKTRGKADPSRSKKAAPKPDSQSNTGAREVGILDQVRTPSFDTSLAGLKIDHQPIWNAVNEVRRICKECPQDWHRHLPKSYNVKQLSNELHGVWQIYAVDAMVPHRVLFMMGSDTSQIVLLYTYKKDSDNMPKQVRDAILEAKKNYISTDLK